MLKTFLLTSALLLAPAAAFAQNPAGATGGAASGAATGAVGGAIVGGPVGAVVGGVGGAVVGGIIGNAQPGFQSYVVEQRVPSYTYDEPLVVGTVLPQRGVVYREVPRQYSQNPYRYTVVNGRTVIVEPETRRVIQIIE